MLSKTKPSDEQYLTPTMEDYVEAIYNLPQEKRVVRVRDIAKRLGVKMPTGTSMLKTLSEKGMIDYEKCLERMMRFAHDCSAKTKEI